MLPPNAPDKVEIDNESFNWTSWGEILSPAKGTEVWATYKGDYYEGNPAVVHRFIGKGMVTYVGVDTQKGELEQIVLKKTFEKAKINIESYPPGILVEYRDGFGVAVNYSDKSFEIKLPSTTKIIIGEKNIATAGVLVWKIN